MKTPNEYTLVEKPILDALGAMTPKYRYIHPDLHPTLRARENEVLFRPLLVKALVRINGIAEAAAEAIYNELAGTTPAAKYMTFGPHDGILPRCAAAMPVS